MLQTKSVVEGSSVETVTPTMVFESFFDGVTGAWSLRRVPAPKRPQIRRIVVRKRVTSAG